MKIKLMVFSSAIVLAAAAVCSADNPHMGTWKLNEAKSHFAKGATKNHTVVYEMSGDQIKVTVDGTDADGNAVHNEWTGKFDGKDYAVTDDPTSDKRSYRAVNNRTMALRAKKGSRVVLTGTIMVSRNGKMRTVTTTSRNAQGKWIHNTAVYDKQ